MESGESEEGMNPRLVFFDTERLPPTWWAWESNKPQYLNHSQLLSNGFFSSIQWMHEWESKPSAYSLTDKLKYFRENPACDKHVCIKAAEVIENVDILVAHNGKRFDWKHLKARWLYHEIPVPKKPYIVDTLTEARTSAFPSNSLAGLSKHLKICEKGTNDADIITMLTGSMKDRIEHINKQTKYGLKDIQPLKELYYRLLPGMERHPNMSAYTGLPCCPRCGSQEYQSRGDTLLSGGIKRKSFSCKNCNKRFQGAVAVRPFFK
jgi:DNA polymerase elongation subunit (family B)